MKADRASTMFVSSVDAQFLQSVRSLSMRNRFPPSSRLEVNHGGQDRPGTQLVCLALALAVLVLAARIVSFL